MEPINAIRNREGGSTGQKKKKKNSSALQYSSTCHEGSWQCTNEVCDSECSVLVNTFYKSFDGHMYFTGGGPCIMVLMQVTNGAQIIQDRSLCPEDSTKVCEKSD